MYAKNLLKLHPESGVKSSEAIAVESQPVSSEVPQQKLDVTARVSASKFVLKTTDDLVQA